MKKLLVLLFIAMYTVYGCGKKQDNSTTGDDKSKEKTETVSKAKEIEISDAKSYHIVYEMKSKETSKDKMSMEVFVKGKKYRSEVSFEEKGVSMKGTGYYKDNMVYSVMNILGKKMGFKMKANEVKDDGQGKSYDAFIMKAKDYLKDCEKVGTEEIIGYLCNVYKDKDGNKYSLYKDYLMMKFEGKGATITATNVEIDNEKDDNFFEPPTDVDYSGLNIDGIKNLKK